MSTSTPYGGGCRCARCGNWVPIGMSHSCPNAIQTTTTYWPPSDPALVRIAVALERIADACGKEQTA